MRRVGVGTPGPDGYSITAYCAKCKVACTPVDAALNEDETLWAICVRCHGNQTVIAMTREQYQAMLDSGDKDQVVVVFQDEADELEKRSLGRYSGEGIRREVADTLSEFD